MGPLDTKLLIADAFVELCDEMPLKKVSISDIVERTGKNRKTFYYHFVDKEALIIGASATIWALHCSASFLRASWCTKSRAKIR